MRVSSTIILAFFGAVASVHASSQAPDVQSVGVLPAFLKYHSMYTAGDHSSKVTDQLKSLGAKLDGQGTDLAKVLGNAPDSMDLLDMIDSYMSLLDSGLSEESLKVRSSSDDDEECEEEEIAAPGKVEQFISLTNKLSSKNASKDPNYKKDLKKLHKLGRQLKKEGSNVKHVVGTEKFGKAVSKMVDDEDDDASVDALEKIIKKVADGATSTEKRDSGVAAPGKVEQFIALNQKLAKPNASKSSTYNQDLKKFQTIGKQLKKDGADTGKVTGTSHTGVALEKIITDVLSDVEDLAGMVTELVGDLLKRDGSSSPGIAAPGKVEQFIALNQKLSKSDASKSPTYNGDLKKFQTIGKQLKKDDVKTEKILGTSHTGVALEKIVTDVLSDVEDLAGMVTELVGDLLKRDVLGDLIGDLIPSPENLQKLVGALSSNDASSSPHYEKSLKNLKTIGLQLKSEGKDPKSLVGSGDQAEALSEMFNQAGDKTSDVRDHSIPILSGRNLHGDAHSHASMARRRAHSHGLEN